MRLILADSFLYLSERSEDDALCREVDRKTLRNGQFKVSARCAALMSGLSRATRAACAQNEHRLTIVRYEYVRSFEQPDVLLSNTWIVVRIDGRGFSKYVVPILLELSGTMPFRLDAGTRYVPEFSESFTQHRNQ